MFFTRKRSFNTACICDIGLQRKNNEDNIYFEDVILPQEHVGTDGILLANRTVKNVPVAFAVFDGVGGEEDGQVASFLAAEKLKDIISVSGMGRINETWVRDIFFRINEYVSSEAENLQNHMATTAVLTVIYDKHIYMGNIGDSRAFMFRHGRLEQMSKDHTDESILKDCNVVKRKPKLMQYIGISQSEFALSPHVVRQKVNEGDMFMICSDGLTDMVSHYEMENIFKKSSGAANCVQMLRDAAIDGGGRDNITITVIKIN